MVGVGADVAVGVNLGDSETTLGVEVAAMVGTVVALDTPPGFTYDSVLSVSVVGAGLTIGTEVSMAAVVLTGGGVAAG